jgi:hypothetical protein
LIDREAFASISPASPSFPPGNPENHHPQLLITRFTNRNLQNYLLAFSAAPLAGQHNRAQSAVP